MALCSFLLDVTVRSRRPVTVRANAGGRLMRSMVGGALLLCMSAIAALAADGKLVKRPIVDAGAHVLVGFDAAAFARQFG